MSTIHIPYARLADYIDIAYAHLDKPESAYKHFTFITKGRKILAIGWNNTYANPQKIDGKPIVYPLGGIHSEASAISRLDDLNMCRKATLVNIRLNKHKQIRNSKPCSVCLPFLQSMGFKRIYYTLDTGFEFLKL